MWYCLSQQKKLCNLNSMFWNCRRSISQKQLCFYYSYQHNAVKLYHQLFHHIWHLTHVNALIGYYTMRWVNTILAASFRELEGATETLATQPYSTLGPLTSSVPVLLTRWHFEHQKLLLACKICFSLKHTPDDAQTWRKWKPFYCKTWLDNPALCPTVCCTTLPHKAPIQYWWDDVFFS